MKTEDKIKYLIQEGLNINEAIDFISCLTKIKPTQETVEAIEKEWEQGIPFEGGMSFQECIIQLTIINLKNG